MNTFESAAAALKTDNWLITPEGFDLLANTCNAQTPTALETMKDDKKIHRQREPESQIAILPVFGPMATYDNFISTLLGWTTYQSLASDIAKYDSTPGVGEIVLYMDTPGGSAKGLSQAASSIEQSNSKVTAYVAGSCASAGYWIASQCASITAAPDAVIGSIGVRTNYYEPKSNELLSENAPNKNMGKSAAQALINDLETLFFEAVAAGRKVSVETVKQNYGKGGVMIGRNALAAGMIDGVSLFHDFVTDSNPKGSHTDSEASSDTLRDLSMNSDVDVTPKRASGRKVY